MVFNSISFFVFLAVVLPLYFKLRHRQQNVMLVVASYVFYGWWDWRFLGLLIFTTFFDYCCAKMIGDTTSPIRKKRLLGLSILSNLGVLGLFKYFDFFAEGFTKVLAAVGMHADLPTLQVILPLGISFYTFLSMSYTIDVYRGQIKASKSPLDFMLYVSFFPHLVAGPIMRAKDLLPQCENPRTVRRSEVINGIWLCILGYLKKVVIADGLASFVNAGFETGSPPFQDANNWLLIYAFAFQIYGDFSGYTDIARGVSKILGFELVHNFKAPYLVSNPASFWRHWHISLSIWLRDYVYIPLGGNRRGTWMTHRNLLITMVLGGLWHGAGAAFIVWGFYHGLLLIIHRVWCQMIGESPSSRLKTTLCTIVFFHLTCIGWLVFRIGTVKPEINQLEMISGFLSTLLILPNSWNPFLWPVMVLGGLVFLVQANHGLMDRFAEWSAKTQAVAVATCLLLIATLGKFEGTSFIYFQF